MADDRTNVFDRGFARLSAEDVSPDCETAELVNEINEMLAAPRAPTFRGPSGGPTHPRSVAGLTLEMLVT